MGGKPFAFRVLSLLALMLFTAAPCLALQSGDTAPTFALKDIQGRTLALDNAKANAMTILFFFDAQSRPSHEALAMLDQLLSRYPAAGLSVWGITRSERAKVDAFVQQAQPKFSILMDGGEVSQSYDAKMVLPVICSVSPELKVVDYHQGGGKTVESMMVALAQRQLHRRQTDLAKAIGEKLTTQSPGGVEARSVKGYAALKSGNLNEAAKVFDAMAQEKGEAEIVGKEGRAAVLARQGKSAEALKVATEVAQKAPKRGYAEMIRGDLLAQQGQSKEALVAYQAAVSKTEGAPFQKAEAYNRLGQFKAKAGEFEQARKLYDQAVAMDPYFLEPTSNKGVSYEKEGRWDKALEQYRKSLTLDGGDTIAAALARKAEEMIAVQKDMQRKERVDKLVKELVERYRQQKSASKEEDDWTSRPMVLSLVDFEEKGGMAMREGFSNALITHIGTLLNTSGRVKVVERVVLDRLLAELNIGSSELADQNTALKLGRVLAAKLIATGSVLHLPEATMLNLRLIDTETTAIAKTYTVTIESQNSLDRRLFDLNRDLLATVMQTYPLRGFVMKMVDERAMLNIGADQGVVQGSRFTVLEESKPVVYKGREIKDNPKPIGELEIVAVEPGLSYGRVLQNLRAFKSDDQVQEVYAAGR